MWFFPPRHGCLALSRSMWSVHTLVLLLLLQKNWLCASQDDSLLPLTALAELTMGDYRYTTDMTKLHPLHSLSCSFSSSLCLSVTFLHCSSNTRMKPYGKLTMLCIPCGQPDVTLRPLDSKTTSSALQLAWTTLMLSFFETVAPLVFSRRSEQRLIKLIKKELLESYQDTLWWDFP